MKRKEPLDLTIERLLSYEDTQRKTTQQRSDCEQGKFATFAEKRKRKSQISANTMRVVATMHRVGIGLA